MTTVSQFMEFLSKLPPDTPVEVLVTYSGQWCVETCMKELDLDEYSDNCSVYGNPPTLYLGGN